MPYLGFSLLALLLAEVASIVLMADWLGGLPTLLLMAVSFAAGLLMLRNLGFPSVMLAGSLFGQQGKVSFYQLLWPLRYIVAALMLMSPGFASTLLALVLLLPIKGGPAAVRAGRGFGRRFGNQGDDVIEGDFQTVRPQQERKAAETQCLDDRGR
ncbi:MAG: FxsA family protein [Eikenella sp.]|nr:FxsA family protein [Eikenella sp.]